MRRCAGDALLRCAGEVLNEVIGRRFYAAWIGGDEFAVLLPATDHRDGQAMLMFAAKRDCYSAAAYERRRSVAAAS
jgi:GGDEF domain-containing protein